MKIGYAMYSAREIVTSPESMESTLKALAEMGYEGVEFFDYAGTGPEQLREMLKKYGLEATSTHVHKPRWDADTAGEIAYAKTAGIPCLVYPWVAPEDRGEGFYRGLAGQLVRLAKQCADSGITLAYHNHDFEFEKMGDNRVIDFLLGSGDSYGFELDAFWAEYAGVKTPDYLRELGSRVSMVHIKDYTGTKDGWPVFTPIGTGRLDNGPIIAAARELGKDWLIVELDDTPYPPLESARVSIENVRKVLAQG